MQRCVHPAVPWRLLAHRRCCRRAQGGPWPADLWQAARCRRSCVGSGRSSAASAVPRWRSPPSAPTPAAAMWPLLRHRRPPPWSPRPRWWRRRRAVGTGASSPSRRSRWASQRTRPGTPFCQRCRPFHGYRCWRPTTTACRPGGSGCSFGRLPSRSAAPSTRPPLCCPGGRAGHGPPTRGPWQAAGRRPSRRWHAGLYRLDLQGWGLSSSSVRDERLGRSTCTPTDIRPP
mmetsp:Transcript_170228/g.540523  ORF Transcript_170228/g.540523 Transcript_170228/m.540523 type:complete len:230 (-) Transcript_170228:17-706(-)